MEHPSFSYTNEIKGPLHNGHTFKLNADMESTSGPNHYISPEPFVPLPTTVWKPKCVYVLLTS